jgi:23S rRNA (guanosine2251-2'-O)-methyltransferase
VDRRRRVEPKRGGGGQRPPGPRVDLDDVIYGIHAVNEAIVAGDPLRRIHIGDERKSDPALRNLIEHARTSEIQVRFESRGFFANFPYKAHQSVIAYGAPFDYITLEEAIALPRTGPALFVLLDHVTDPHNVGAIIRTTEAVGGTALILPERRAAGVNATVRKSAAGATAHLPIARVANVSQAVRTLKKAGIWVAGAALGPGTIPLAKADFNRDLAIVIGAEGEGIAPLVGRECDYRVQIPMYGKTQSLNASVAAGMLLYEAIRQRQGL